MTDFPENVADEMWGHIKKYINTNDLADFSTKGLKKTLDSKLENFTDSRDPRRHSFRGLVENSNFTEQLSMSEAVKRDLATGKIKEIKIKGKTRYQVGKGVKPDGIRAGQFLSGKTIPDALKDFLEKADEKGKPRQTYAVKMGYAKKKAIH